MQERQLSTLDRLLIGANNALRTIAAPAGHSARKDPATDIAETDLSDKQKAHSAGFMRVNHAGERAAQARYKGRAIVEQMRDEEEEHGESAVGAGAAELPASSQRLMQLTAKVMTNTAYRL